MIPVDRIPRLPSRAADSHKGSFGHVLVLAGSLGMGGAAILAANAALRSGVGLATLGVPAPIHPAIVAAVPCALTLPLPATAAGTFSRDALQPALDLAAGGRISAVALGPGITTDEDAATFANRIAQRVRTPLVLDADGLNCLAKHSAPLRSAPAPRILTPHPGEAARLLDRPVAEIQADREGAAAALVERFDAVIVLKGAGTIVADASRRYVNTTGNPGMATGGTGDVLTGLVAGLLAQGMDPFDAAVLGVFVHGRAGDLAAQEIGQAALIATDLLGFIGPAFRTVPA